MEKEGDLKELFDPGFDEGGAGLVGEFFLRSESFEASSRGAVEGLTDPVLMLRVGFQEGDGVGAGGREGNELWWEEVTEFLGDFFGKMGAGSSPGAVGTELALLEEARFFGERRGLREVETVLGEEVTMGVGNGAADEGDVVSGRKGKGESGLEIRDEGLDFWRSLIAGLSGGDLGVRVEPVEVG